MLVDNCKQIPGGTNKHRSRASNRLLMKQTRRMFHMDSRSRADAIECIKVAQQKMNAIHDIERSDEYFIDNVVG